jgi:putative redox protein
MSSRTVDATWEGGLRCTVQAGRFHLTVDEPESSGGTDTGPQPTDLFLSSIASCFVLAIAWAANKRGIGLGDVRVSTTGTYKGLRFAEVTIRVSCDPRPAEFDELLAAAEKYCYVSNTLREVPVLEVRAEP